MQGKARCKTRMRSASHTQQLTEPRYSESLLFFLFLLGRQGFGRLGRGRILARIDVRENLDRISTIVRLLRRRLGGGSRLELYLPGESSNDFLRVLLCRHTEVGRWCTRTGEDLSGGFRISEARWERFLSGLKESICPVA